MFILLVIDLFHESIRLCGGLGCLPRVLDYGSNFTEAGAADGASAGNACHLLHLLGRSTKQTVLRLLAEVLFENVDAKVHTLSTNIHLRSGYEFTHLILGLAAERAPQNFRSAPQNLPHTRKIAKLYTRSFDV